jgi:hypothetical protein
MDIGQIIRMGVGSNYRADACHIASTKQRTVLKGKVPEFFVSAYGLDMSLHSFTIPEPVVTHTLSTS